MFKLVPFLSYAFVVTFTPGPNNIMSMANANRFGFKKNFKFILGVFTGFFIILLLSSYFNLILFNILPKIRGFMGLLGAGYMTYLAIKIMKSNKEVSSEDNRQLVSFFTGMAIQFVNPKGILYGITVMSTFIIPYYKSNVSLFLFSIFLASLAFVSTLCWAAFGIIFQRFLSKYRRYFNILMGLLLIYSAISIIRG
ncbi:MAG: LysE family transporter [Clostridia bacterium]|nr:LysE family transporter [Clostridia bacterium]